MSVTDTLAELREARDEIQDVFLWPDVKDTLAFIHEETCELKRVYDKRSGALYLRRQADPITDPLKEEEEFGDLLGMVLCYAIQRDIDPQRALHRHIWKIRQRAEAARYAAGQPLLDSVQSV